MRALVGTLVVLLVQGNSRAADFALRDGDTVVFLGDSITAARTYGKIIENYTLLRFPERKLRFFNEGWGGDTAAGGLARLERDVLPHHPTVVIVAYGTNDIGWGLKADDEHRKIYLDAVRGIVTACKKRKIRVFLCSAAITGADPAKSEDSFLQKMCDEGMALARREGEQAIDVQRTMRTIQKRVWAYNEKLRPDQKKTTLHAADGVHLNDLGQLAMAYAILKGLNAPAEVSSVSLDAQTGKVKRAQNCKITEVVTGEGRVEFTRLDGGLPFNYGLFYALNFAFVPVGSELNGYALTIENLPEGKYEVQAEGRGVGHFPARLLAQGVNIASTTTDAWQPGGPWNAQANILQSLTDARHQLAIATLQARTYLPRGEVPGALQKPSAQTDEELIAMQRLVARPRPYRFVVRKVEPMPEKKP